MSQHIANFCELATLANMSTRGFLITTAGALTGIALLAGCGGSSEESAESATPSAKASSASASAVPSMPAPGDPIATADLPELVSDRTFSGSFAGEPYDEYYAADGTLRGTSAGESYTGSWEVVGDELCFTYPDTAGGEAEVDCYTAYRDGNKIVWMDSEGNVLTTTYQAGNPLGL